MTQFEKMTKQEQIKCDICGKLMLPLPGGGWDNDRFVCADIRNCGAEIVFPTSTEIEEHKVTSGPLTALLASLVSKGDELRDACTKTYFGHLCVAFTTRNSLKHYSAFPWNFAIRDGDSWHHYCGIPNKVETRAKALRRAWYRAKWMHDGTYGEHYKANAPARTPGETSKEMNDGPCVITNITFLFAFLLFL